MNHQPDRRFTTCSRNAAAALHMSFRAYKLTKALVQLAAVAAGIYAMSLGAAPLPTFVGIAVIVTGPEMFEYYVENDLAVSIETQDDEE
jgi:hypothetical protein